MELKKGEFFEYGKYITVEKALLKGGFEVVEYKELSGNGVYTLKDGTKISTNGYVYTK